MKKQVIIASESGCDLPLYLREKHNVKILPGIVYLGEEIRRDGVDVTAQDLFDYYKTTKEIPKTAALNIIDIQEFFEQFTEQGYAVVYFTLSTGITNVYHNAVLAASELEDVHVVDSKTVSTGISLQILKAVEMRDSGMEAAQIAEESRKLSEKVSTSFIIDSLEFLKKSGRCSSLSALGAGLLNIKPCISVQNDDGTMGVSKKYKGKLENICRQYVKDKLTAEENLDLSRIFISHSCSDHRIIEAITETIKECAGFKEIIEANTGCTISTHCGENTFGILYMRG